MGEAAVRLPMIGISAIDLGPAELREVPMELASKDPEEITLASLEFAFAQAMKRAVLSGVDKTKIDELIESAKNKL